MRLANFSKLSKKLNLNPVCCLQNFPVVLTIVFNIVWALQSDLTLACWVRNAADDILKYFSYFFFQKMGFVISCRLSPRRQFALNVKAYFL